MSYQTPKTIKDTLESITSRTLVLPAIQREFVWQPDQICSLFDSLMQGYPFGTFLYWKVNAENSGNFQFYDFVLDYHERDQAHNEPLPNMPSRELTAVLDGQQRLTALNIGLLGSMALKLPRLWWNNPNAFPTKKLYLDLLWQPNEFNEEGIRYKFSFLTKGEAETADNGKCWFPVEEIFSMRRGTPMFNWVTDKQLPTDLATTAFDTLDMLHEVVHTKPIVNFYEESSQELEKVLQIFIRTNRGGTPLSYSDLLLSIAVAQWKQYDAREEIHALVDDLNRIGIGFTFSKDLVLKASLMLSDIGSVGFNVDNFDSDNMSSVEGKWEGIKHALTLTVQLVSQFGFTGQNLSAPSAILPIAYYLYKRQPEETYLTRGDYEEDREAVHKWLVESLLKSGIWSGGSADGMLTTIRNIIKESSSEFPVIRIREEMARLRRSLVFEDEEIDDLVDMKYGSRLTFALLSLLFPFVNLTNHFHVDHVFPRSRFTKMRLKNAGVPDEGIREFVDRRDRLANLQLLEGAENMEKRAKLPSEWLKGKYSDPANRQAYQDLHDLGRVPDDIVQFDSFYEARRERLKARISELLGRQPASVTASD